MLDSFRESSKRRDRQERRKRSLRRIEEAASCLSKIEEQRSADMVFSEGAIFDCGLELSPDRLDDSETETVGTDFDLETISSYAFDENSNHSNSDVYCDAGETNVGNSPTRRENDRRGSRSLDRVLINVVEYKIVGDGGAKSRSAFAPIKRKFLIPRSWIPLVVGLILGIFLITTFVTITWAGDPILNSGLLRLRGGLPGGHAFNDSAVSDAENDDAAEEKGVAPPQAADEEAEPDVADFCGKCQWKHAPFNCDKRVKWEMERYDLTEMEAKLANLQHCMEPPPSETGGP